MPQIGILWQKYKSAIANDFSAIGLDQDFFLSILNAVDEGGTLNSRSGEPNTSGVEAGLETFRQMKQSGTVLLNVRDKNGNPIPNLNLSELFIDNKQLDKAEKYMQLILQQYELLKIALAQSDVTEGQTGRPRTTVTAIEAAIESSNNAQWFVEYPVRECLIMFGERAVQHLICIIRDKVKYKDTKRWDSITEVIGLSNALMLEGVVDIPLEDIGLTVSLEDTQQVKDYIFQLANEMVKTKEISFDALGVVIDSNRFNWKYAFAILNLAKKQQEKENAAQQQLQFEQQKELENIRLQTALALVGGKSQARQQEIGAQAQADAQIAQMTNELKHQSQSDLKQQTTQNRILENDEKEKSKANVEVQKALI